MVVLMLLLMLLLLLLLILSGDLLLLLLLMILGVERAASAASSLVELLLCLELRSLLELFLMSMLVELVEADNEDHVSSHSQCRYLQGPKFFLLCSASIAGLHHCTPKVYLSRFQLVLLL